MANVLTTLLFMLLLCIGFCAPSGNSLSVCYYLQLDKFELRFSLSDKPFLFLILLNCYVFPGGRTIVIPIASYGTSEVSIVLGISGSCGLSEATDDELPPS